MTVGRTAACLLVVALLTVACTSSPSPVPSGSGASSAAPALPSETAVRDGRFTVPVALDDGTLTVDPAPRNITPAWLTIEEASTMVWASPTVTGSHSGAVLGFGVVSVEPAVQGEGGILMGERAIHDLPAWVGFAWGGIYNCPAILTGSPTHAHPLPSSGYEAVVIPTDGGASAFSYAARTSTCGRPPTGPSIALARYVVSIPWKSDGKVKNGSVLVRYTPPACGTEESSSVSGDVDGSTFTISLFWSIPVSPLPCPSPMPRTEKVSLYPPGTFSSGGAVVLLHGKIGPARQIQLGP